MADLMPLQAEDPASLGRYRLLGRLGSGGQGVVYLGYCLGRDGESEQQVAIKLLHAQLIEDAAARLRFVRELAVVQRVAGFCTAQVLDADVAGDRPYIVSEYVPGPSLQDLVREAGPRTGADLDRLAIGTVTALAAIHRAGIVHRDFKPPNVLMGPDGPRVIDFGIARALNTFTSLTSQMIGTPAYMAPEQLTDDRAGPATDLFTWAATMLFAATGHAPFEGPSIPVVAFRVLNLTPDLSALPDRLAEQVAACLDKDPAQRPQAEEVLLRLLGAGAGSGFLAETAPYERSDHAPVTSPDPSTSGASTLRKAAPPPAPGGPDPTPPDQAVQPAAPAAPGQAPVPGAAPRPGPAPPPGPPPGWPGRPPAPAPGAPAKTLGFPGPTPAEAQPAAEAPATAWLPNAEQGATLLQPRPPTKERLRRTPVLLAGLALAFLSALFDVVNFGYLTAPSATSASNRVAFLLVSAGFALLGLITMIAVAFALRGGRAAIWTVLSTRIVHAALWVVWKLPQSIPADQAVVNLGASVLLVLLLGYALWRARPRPTPQLGQPLEPPW